MASQDRRVRHARGLQPLRGRLGARDGHAVPVDQAGGLALGRHAQRHDRALAERASRRKGEMRAAVPPRHRRRRRPCSRPPGCPSPPRQRRPADAARGRQHGLRLRRRRRRRSATTTQYFEMFCNRGIYHKGWTAVTRHSTPWVIGARCRPFDDDVWELYDTERLDAGPRPRRRAAGQAAPSCSGCS